jgi:RNA polymerase sigma-70 factor (ECF subfamily)
MAQHSLDLDQVLTQARPVIVRYCRARLGRHDQTYAAADLLAAKVLRDVLKSLPTNHKPLMALVYGVASQLVDEALVDEHVRVQPDVLVPWLLDELPREQREIIVLRVAVRLSAEETAAAMGYTAAAVRLAQHRALTRLRKATAPAYVV